MKKTVLSLIISTILLSEGALVYAEPGVPPGMGDQPELGMDGQPGPGGRPPGGDKPPKGEKPELGMDGQPEPGMDGQPEPGMHGQPESGMHGQPEPGMDGQPEPGMHGQPEPGMDGQPEPGMHGQPEPGMDGQPEPGMDGQPEPGDRPPEGEKPEPGMDGQPEPMPIGEKPDKGRPQKPNKLLQDAGIDPDQIQNFDKDAVKKLKPEQMAAFDQDNVGLLPAEALDELTAEQLGRVSKHAAKGFTPKHVAHIPPHAFKGLSHENLGGLEPDALRAITPDQLGQLDPNEFQALSGKEKAKIFANLDPNMDAEQVKNFLPPGWVIKNGKGLGRPMGVAIELPPLPKRVIAKLMLPNIPDLQSGFGLGGNVAEGETNALDGINGALDGTGFTVEQQEEGVLRVTDGDGGTEFAFLPDGENMEQGDPDAAPGVTIDEEGKFVLVLKGGYRVPVRPACKDPAGLAEMLPETGEAEIDENAQVRLQLDDAHVVSGVFDFQVIDASSDLPPPGVHIIGEGKHKGMMVVYKSGKAQMVRPALKSPDKFKEMALKIPGVEKIILNMDGTISVIFQGTPLLLRPALEVEQMPSDAAEEATIEPTIDVTEDGSLVFVDEQGDTQELSIEMDDGSADDSEEVTDEEATDEEATDEEVTDEEVTDEEVTDEEATDEEATDEEATDEEVTDEEATDEEATDEEATDEEATDEEVTDEEATDEEDAIIPE